MYIKIEQLQDAIERNYASADELKNRLSGMINPFKTYTQEEVDREQNKAATAEPDAEKKKRGSGFFGFLEVVLDDMIKNREALSENIITLQYTKEEVSEINGVKSDAIYRIVDDFKIKFEEKFHGQPSLELIAEVVKSASKQFRSYVENNRADNPRGLQMDFVLPHNIGKCECGFCKVETTK